VLDVLIVEHDREPIVGEIDSRENVAHNGVELALVELRPDSLAHLPGGESLDGVGRPPCN
jgi:hypothetical protein